MMYWNARRAQARVLGGAGTGNGPAGLGGPALLVSAVFIASSTCSPSMSLPRSLVRDLHAGPGSLELVIGGYAFAYAAGLITGGRLGDLFGYRRVLVPGMTGFGVMSLLCGLAASPRRLVAARMLQGLSGALMVPQVLALITATIPAGRQQRAANPRTTGRRHRTQPRRDHR